METQNKEIATALESWTEEKKSVYLYQIIAKHSAIENQQKLFHQLAKEAESQANIWANEIVKMGGKIPEHYKPDMRTFIVGWLIKRFGPQSLHTILSAMKVRGMSIYSTEIPGHPMPQSMSDIGRHHKSLKNGNNLRAAVFGINDGLVSNASLILGMAGAAANVETIIIAGIAGLFAGACSMAAGEFVSVRSQREMFEYQIDLERKELELYPKQEAEELAIIYHARGLPKEQADKVANTIMQDPKNALDVLAHEELGLSPENLVSPYGAAIFSFIFFVIGAGIPLFPFIFTHHLTIHFAIGLTGLSLFAVGSILSLYTGHSAIKSGLRMLLIGAAAGGITYLIGHIFKLSLG
jgi:VIT1/CCC1 family predicted Fe2+/Mn2+ transporter